MAHLKKKNGKINFFKKQMRGEGWPWPIRMVTILGYIFILFYSKAIFMRNEFKGIIMRMNEWEPFN
jgi:hypothetical protein